ncbi:ketopantoate reductase family protein [Paenibacillus monticola]|uniref:2-dehydropantoate 2-reductase n=1 Tax=Paenibacillus monticola TaxID=2666075 RepID=A0A7X2H903_9BACL|nr:2-dehydropantoate 2-reductase [Paenibacillus monticola]MRN55681.1 2-dehydropantoate 2-reductase [Paenibacillus monticola]
MKIDIIGAGSLGLLLAGKLIHAGNEVRLWCRSVEQCRELSNSGLSVSFEDDQAEIEISGDQFVSAPVREFPATYLREPSEWIVITVKQDILHHVLPEFLSPLRQQQTYIVCFQNGLGHMEMLQELLPYADLYAVVTTEAAKRKTLTKVIHAGKGESWLGKWPVEKQMVGEHHKEQDEIQAISLLGALSLAGFTALLSKEVDTMIYRKLLINAVINPLTAIWRIPNGGLLVSEQRMQLMRELYAEAISVYEACGIVHEDNAWDNILAVCQSTAGNTSSMLADVLASRATEIRWINGSLVEMAERSGMAVPLHRWICQLIEGMSAEER